MRPSSDRSDSDQRITVRSATRRNGAGLPRFGAYFPLCAVCLHFFCARPERSAPGVSVHELFLIPNCERAEIPGSLSVGTGASGASGRAQKNLEHRPAVYLTWFAGIAGSNLILLPWTVNS